MDQKQIGKFIAECRKNKKLTQEQLAEKLNISDRAVSKWERGLNLPDASLMLELSKIFDISVNELLTGKLQQDKTFSENDKNTEEELPKQKNKKMLFVFILFLIAILLKVIKISETVDESKNSSFHFLETLEYNSDVDSQKLINENIVKVVNNTSYGTITGVGFFINENFLLTNSHVVDINGDIEIQYNDGTKSSATIYSNSIKYDLALLSVEKVNSKIITLKKIGSDKESIKVLYSGINLDDYSLKSANGEVTSKTDINLINYFESSLFNDFETYSGIIYNDKAEVIGMNTYYIRDKKKILALSNNSILLITDLLISNPSVEYYGGERNDSIVLKYLTQSGDNKNFNNNLYKNDFNINNQDEKKENNNVSYEYYCQEGYVLKDDICVKEYTYPSTKTLLPCKEGFKHVDGFCKYEEFVDFNITYKCPDDYTLISNDKCYKEGYVNNYPRSSNSRYGSCPSGKKCYEFDDKYDSTFVDSIICPSDSYKVYSGYYIWDGEEDTEENYKYFKQIDVYGYRKEIDNDGQIFYKNHISNVAINCAKKKENGIYTFYTFEQLSATACPNGKLVKSIDSNGIQGFYCVLNVKPKLYRYDLACGTYYEELYEDKEAKTIYCREYKKETIDSKIEKKCPNGYVMTETNCVKTNINEEKYEITCNKYDALLNEDTCQYKNMYWAKKRVKK